ncbi:MAG: sulfurtransferase TusA family protein [Pseudomonadota bacterium]
MEITDTLNATGLLCPLPVLKAAKRLRAMQAGEVLEVLADDPAAIVDMPHFCVEQGHTLLDRSELDGIQRYVIRKA